MKERPILFSAPMVRAILEGRKSMTRRVAKLNVAGRLGRLSNQWHPDIPGAVAVCPYGQAGDRLWVREAHTIYATYGQGRSDGQRWGPWGGLPTTVSPDGMQIAYYREGFDRCDPGRWRPSIHMPRWASRITLEVTGVRVERLQDISTEDALAEGVRVHSDHHKKPRDSVYSPVQAFRDLWENINDAGSWDANPWVWVVEFKRIEATA